MKIKGIFLKQALQLEKIKQEDAANKLGISRSTLSVWCNKEYLTDDIIYLIRTKLGIDLTNVNDQDSTNEKSSFNEAIVNKLIESFEAKEKLYKQIISDKDEMIQELKNRLGIYEGKNKSKTGTN